MQRTLALGALAAAMLTSAAVSQNLVPLPPHNNTYTFDSRGYHFTAQTNFEIVQMEVPPDSYLPGNTSSFRIDIDRGNGRVNGVFYASGGTNSVQAVVPPVQVFAGDIVVISGNWSDVPVATQTANTSYTASFALGAPYTVNIEGVQHDLYRATVSGDVGNPASLANSFGLATSGQLGRMFIYTAPLTGVFADFDASPVSGPSPLTVNFSDTSVAFPGPITSWAWDFENDGTVDSTLQNPSFTYGCGTFDVSLTVSDGTNSDTIVKTGLIVTDDIVPSFTYQDLGAGVVQFTDTSTPTPTSWAWDLDGDGVVDSTMQNPTFAYPSTRASALVTLDAFNQCMGQFTARQSLIIAPSSFLGETGGGNGTSSGTAAGNYFDVQITNPEGINVFGVGVTPYDRVGLVQVDVYVTADTHVGKEGVASEWMHVGTGQGWSVGAPFTAPAVVPVALGSEFYLPVGNYGMAVYLSVPGGGTIPIAYTNGPAGSPYVGADLVIHPNGVGCSSVSLLGGCSFSPRLWNGGFYYSTFSQTGEAAVGFFGNGCDGSLGRSGLSYSGAPVLGTTMTVTVDTLPVDTAVLMNGFNNQASAFGPLPFDVGPLGAPGCFLRVDPVLNGFLVGTGGSASWSLQIPNWTILMGLPLFQQAVVFDPGFNAIGGVGSDAYGMHFGM